MITNILNALWNDAVSFHLKDANRVKFSNKNTIIHNYRLQYKQKETKKYNIILTQVI